MKITICKTIKEEIEIGLPIYRRHDLDYSTVFMRVSDDGQGRLIQHSITVRDNESVEIEIHQDYRFDGSQEDYLLGRGAYACSRDEFEAAIENARAFIEKLSRVPDPEHPGDSRQK